MATTKKMKRGVGKYGRRNRPLKLSETAKALIKGLEERKQKEQKKKEETKKKRQRQTEHARLTQKANRMRATIQTATELGYTPAAFLDTYNILTNELQQPPGSRNWKKLKDAVQYMEQNEYYKDFSEHQKEYEEAGSYEEEASAPENVREDITRLSPSFWITVEYLRDMGLSSQEAIDAVQRYNEDTGGKPINAALDRYARVIYDYIQSGVDEYEDAVASSKMADSAPLSELFKWDM